MRRQVKDHDRTSRERKSLHRKKCPGKYIEYLAAISVSIRQLFRVWRIEISTTEIVVDALALHSFHATVALARSLGYRFPSINKCANKNIWGMTSLRKASSLNLVGNSSIRVR
jgi:hypothetical protein